MVERTLISLPSQLQLIERLQHLIYLSSSLIFVSGEIGSGKSTLTENLSNLVPSDLQQVYISLTNVPTASKLRQQIVSQLFDKALFNAEDKLLDTIVRLQQTGNRSQNRLVIIDNANNLPTEFIIELCELFSEPDVAQNNTINILLLADEMTNQQYIEYIETHLVSRIRLLLNYIELTLPSLTNQEASGLLQHNFQQVAYQAKLQHQDALHKQLKLCHGNPQKIIKLADDLSQGLLEPITNSWVRTRLPAILLMLLLVAIVSIFAVYLYPKFIPKKPTVDTLPNPIEVRTVEHNADKISTTSTSVTTQENKPAQLAGSWADFDVEITDNKNTVGLSDEVEKRVIISGQQLLELTVLTDSLDKKIIDPDHEDSHVIEVPEVDTNKQFEAVIIEQQAPLLVLPAENAKQIAGEISVEPVATVVTPRKEVDKEQSLSVVEKSTPIETPEVVIDKVKEAEVKPENNGLFTANKTLFAKDPTHYTIQLSGMASREYLVTFQQQYNTAQENVYTYQTVRNNKPWFVVVYGEYTSIKAAQFAANNLPGIFKNRSTWVKAWRVVHNDLRLNDE